MCPPTIKVTKRNHKILELMTLKKKFTQISIIDFVNGVNWLQVLQNTSSKKERYLTVSTGWTSWAIGPTIDEGWKGSFIQSGSAGGLCPADPTTRINKRLGYTSWMYADGKGGRVNGDIKLFCSTHFPKK